MRIALHAAALLLINAALLNPAAAQPRTPFFAAGVQGGADANEGSSPCALPGMVSGGYQTFPLGAFLSYAEGTATAFNPCSALSGSPLSAASANLATGQLRAYALAQLDNGKYLQEAKASAYFRDDVNLFLNGSPVTVLANGQVGEMRLDIHGNRSAELLDAEARLELDDMLGRSFGDERIEDLDLRDGQSLVVRFDAPFSFFAYLSVSAQNGQYADFGSTGTISISLPPGYTFSSSSGVLLAVPEPASAGFMFVGLGLVGLALRGRRPVAKA